MRGEGETLDSDEHVTVCYELQHVLLLEFADMVFVEFDRFKDEIRRGTLFDEMRPFLEQTDGDHDE
jgi:hypothetical protein